MNKQVYKSQASVVSVGVSDTVESKGFFNRLFHANGNARNNNLMQSQNGLKSCLDSLQMNVFVADKNLNLIYMNEIARATMLSVEPEIRKEFRVGVDELLGGSIHRFHKNPQQVESILRNPTALPHKAELAFGNVILRSNIHGIWDEKGEVQGYVVNWEEVGELKKVELEQARVNSMMDSAPFNILFCDCDLTLRYANPASMKTLKTLEQYLPARVDELIGNSIDIFHKNPAHQRKLLSRKYRTKDRLRFRQRYQGKY